MMYKIHVNNRDYSSWDIYQADTQNKVDGLTINPIESKLLTNDIFTIDKHGTVQIEHSSIRSGGAIPGVLMIDGNKTYGRDKSSKHSRLLYKCIPDDVRLPAFLVPYEIKQVGFSKVFKNLYITFIFDKWDDKHPCAKLDSVIGQVDIAENFYEYQLYCKSLNASISKFQKDTHKAIVATTDIFDSILEKYPTIEDRRNSEYYVITIDPLNSQDFDDGFSYNDQTSTLSIYIANVSVMLDALNLWNSFSRRVSTIYLPDKKRPMLPTILSDCLCSLQKSIPRIAFVMDVIVTADGQIADISFTNAVVSVRRNYTYEEPQLLGDPEYHKILAVAQRLTTKYRYLNEINDSHDLVSYLMILMNYYSAKKLMEYNAGIFRSTIMTGPGLSVPDTIPVDVAKFISIWSSATGQYVDGSEIVSTRHEMLDLDAYIHITSPIRRLVDLLNMIKMQSLLGTITLTSGALEFYGKWISQLEYINTTMRSIRKVQVDCALLDLCHNDEQVLEKIYDGYLFDKIQRSDGLFQYMVFLPDIKLSSRITIRDDCENFSCKKFKLFLFSDEERFKKKIRLHIYNN